MDTHNTNYFAIAFHKRLAQNRNVNKLPKKPIMQLYAGKTSLLCDM